MSTLPLSYQEVCTKGNLILTVAETLNITEIISVSSALVKCFETQRVFLEQLHNMNTVKDALTDTVAVIGNLTSICEGLTRSPYAEHAKTAQEISAAFSWVTISSEPHTFIKETMEGASYWGNKVMVANKSKDSLHVDWVRAIQQSFNTLIEYVKLNYPCGLQGDNARAPEAKSSPVALEPGNVTFLEVTQCVQQATEAGSLIDTSVHALTNSLLCAVLEMGTLIETAKSTVKPSDMSEILRPLTKRIEALQNVCNEVCSNPKFKVFALSIRELIPCLSWVVTDDAPATFVKENSEAADFHFNKILKERETNQDMWVKAFKEFIRKLIAYIKEQHGNGMIWSSSSSTSLTTDSNLFDALQRGTAITEGLRKVTDQEKVYKQKRAETTVINVSTLAERKKGKGWAPPSGNQSIKLVGNKKWMVEYYCGTSEVDLVDVVIDGSEKHHAIFVSRCQNAVIRVPSKVNTVSINECLRTKVILEGTIGPVEVANSHFTEVMYSLSVPSLMIDKCQDTNIYVPEERVMEFEAITSLSANTNVILPTLLEERMRNEDVQETKSLPIPEQFVSRINTKDKLVTSPTEHSCG